ncbi:formate dehydrogenase accessory sulfurtransferase FdhD [Microbacterium protaetiae]|uniref:Sulfur carrier protein FdhD n=1 Tax=Microbacterium protaetiae TaxID=2509458 RepID=A0A4P6EGI3_9MICO|nr:formate dehydrogenase accessory sulfurtransferase FdhD [Microbacterium protaetiae]QAY60553.1 formate dehydrogenase accessory sulfurtransferase FdhD [Microbacterium protaetiae]
MGRITTRTKIVRVVVGADPDAAMVRRMDTLAAEEPLEIRVGGAPLTVTMRTPGNDVELAAGFLVSEGVIFRGEQFASAIHCGGPGTSGPAIGSLGLRTIAGSDGGNTYNVLDVALAPGTPPPDPARARHSYTTSACGVCGAASIDQVTTASAFDVSSDPMRVDAAVLARLPEALRAQQAVFDKTGGLHAAALCDAQTGEVLVVREDVGRHNAVDKVVGWALLHDRLPLRGTVLQVSGRASFELVQKAVMAGIPALSAVSAPSSLAVEMAERSGLTLVGFVRGESMNVYARPDRVRTDALVPA